MSAEMQKLTKQIVGYAPGVTYKLGDWLASTLANCEKVLATTTARDTAKREAVALALATVSDATGWSYALDEDYSEYLFNQYPESLRALSTIALTHVHIEELMDPDTYDSRTRRRIPGQRFHKERALKRIKEFRAYVKKHQAQLDTIKFKFTAFDFDLAARELTANFTFKLGRKTYKHAGGSIF